MRFLSKQLFEGHLTKRTNVKWSIQLHIICIGNHMISSAIWNKWARVNFSKTNKIARARRASAIWGLWKIYKWLFQIAQEKSCDYLVTTNIHEKFRDGLAEETHAYHTIREKLRHPGRALDLKAKDLIGHLWVSLIIDKSECLVCFLFLHWINSFLHCLKKTALLLTNQKG